MTPERTSPVRPSWSHSDRLLARRLARPVRSFLGIEAAGGVLLIAATVAALAWANSPWSHSYASFWHTDVGLVVGPWSFRESLGLVVNDALMALFFFVIGLEIKREWVTGELRDRRAAVLPAVAALGGMVVPAAIYAAFTAGTDAGHGWGIPMATDVAFALGVVALLGRRVPPPLKVFLLTLAIVDDIGAIVVIAIFYSESLSMAWLAAAVAILVLVAGLSRLHVRWMPVFVVLGVAAWYATFRSGVNATIAGVALGLLTPAQPFQPPGVAADLIRRLRVRSEGRLADEVADVRRDAGLLLDTTPVLDRIEATLHPWTSYVIVPVFALANAGIALGDGVSGAGEAVSLGVILGLVVGKTVGVAGTSWLVVRLGWSTLPSGVRWPQLTGIATLAGIGFTVSLFVTGLAFPAGAAGAHLADHAKLGILVASVLAAAIGATTLSVAHRRHAAT